MSRIEAALRRATESNPGDAEALSGELPVEQAFADDIAFADVGADTPIEAELNAPEPEPAEKPAEAGPAVLSKTLVRHYTDDKLIVSPDITPIAVEQYRRTAAALHQLQTDRQCRVVMVASAIAGEGKTLTACNIALTLTESFRRRVLLIDADLRRPSVHRAFRLDNTTGLNEGLRAEREAKLPIVEPSPRLSVLPAGRPDPDPMSSLVSPRMRQIVEEAAARFDWVIIDTPPIGLLPDAKLLASMADLVILVIGAGTTPLGVVERAIESLDRERIVGVVLNRVTEHTTQYSYYAHYASGVDNGRLTP